MDEADRARIREEARITARENTKYGFKLLLKIMAIGLLGLATCSYIALHSVP